VSDFHEFVLVAIVMLVMFGVGFAIVAIVSPGKPLVSTDVEENTPWKLILRTIPERKQKLCLRFDIRYEGAEDNFGLVVDYRCEASGVVLVQERAGVGDFKTPERDREISVMHGSSFSSTWGKCKHRATIVLAKLEPFTAGVDLTAQGKLLLSKNVRLEEAQIYFA